MSTIDMCSCIVIGVAPNLTYFWLASDGAEISPPRFNYAHIGF